MMMVSEDMCFRGLLGLLGLRVVPALAPLAALPGLFGLLSPPPEFRLFSDPTRSLVLFGESGGELYGLTPPPPPAPPGPCRGEPVESKRWRENSDGGSHANRHDSLPGSANNGYTGYVTAAFLSLWGEDVSESGDCWDPLVSTGLLGLTVIASEGSESEARMIGRNSRKDNRSSARTTLSKSPLTFWWDKTWHDVICI